MNPVRSGIVEKPEDYLYSSAQNYAWLKGKIEIDIWCVANATDIEQRSEYYAERVNEIRPYFENEGIHFLNFTKIKEADPTGRTDNNSQYLQNPPQAVKYLFGHLSDTKYKQ